MSLLAKKLTNSKNQSSLNIADIVLTGQPGKVLLCHSSYNFENVGKSQFKEWFPSHFFF